MNLYHGTRRPFKKGGLLLPRDVHGGASTSAPLNGPAEPSAESWVYVTESLNLAWAYAYAAPGRGKPRVLRVHPMGRIEPDHEHSAEMCAWRCESAGVVAVYTIPPMTAEEAAKGWMTPQQ